MNKLQASLHGTNFWVSIVLFIGGLFVGFPTDLAAETVDYWVAGIAGIFAVREKLKSSTIDWRAWLGNTNTFAYLGTVITALIPVIPMQLFTDLASLAQAALGGNWQGIVVAAFSIATIIFHLVKPKAPPSPV
jgi:hypothetical protein